MGGGSVTHPPAPVPARVRRVGCLREDRWFHSSGPTQISPPATAGGFTRSYRSAGTVTITTSVLTGLCPVSEVHLPVRYPPTRPSSAPTPSRRQPAESSLVLSQHRPPLLATQARDRCRARAVRAVGQVVSPTRRLPVRGVQPLAPTPRRGIRVHQVRPLSAPGSAVPDRDGCSRHMAAGPRHRGRRRIPGDTTAHTQRTCIDCISALEHDRQGFVEHSASG